ncbi:amidohydrolase family protein [Microbacterium sp. NIBRBAC000506063]|uniref:amidohydrolase family protein n=1 Tax=Microbacterium sp. NIBRBAC000506063 TaxID=2734618 RepID=UPI0021D401D6|nr:amidohydrolase [Microbacterium sp. NIBRBAC000506063]
MDRPLTPTALVGLMDASGVSNLLQVTRYFDPTDDYSLAGFAEHPDRFRVLGRFDASLLHDQEELAARVARPGMVGLRIFTYPTDARLFADAAAAFWAMVESLHLPISIYAPGHITAIREVAVSYPHIPIVLDHGGTDVFVGTDPERRFDEWDAALEMAALPNVSIKASALPEATSEAFPYPDAQRRLRELCAAYGSGRVMWGPTTRPPRGSARMRRWSSSLGSRSWRCRSPNEWTSSARPRGASSASQAGSRGPEVHRAPDRADATADRRDHCAHIPR